MKYWKPSFIKSNALSAQSPAPTSFAHSTKPTIPNTLTHTHAAYDEQHANAKHRRERRAVKPEEEFHDFKFVTIQRRERQLLAERPSPSLSHRAPERLVRPRPVVAMERSELQPRERGQLFHRRRAPSPRAGRRPPRRRRSSTPARSRGSRARRRRRSPRSTVPHRARRRRRERARIRDASPRVRDALRRDWSSRGERAAAAPARARAASRSFRARVGRARARDDATRRTSRSDARRALRRATRRARAGVGLKVARALLLARLRLGGIEVHPRRGRRGLLRASERGADLGIRALLQALLLRQRLVERGDGARRVRGVLFIATTRAAAARPGRPRTRCTKTSRTASCLWRESRDPDVRAPSTGTAWRRRE